MPRSLFLPSAVHHYHICARTNNRDWFSVPIDEVWDIMGRYLFYMNRFLNVRIHAFVLMSNHFHLIAHFPEANVAESLQYFMRETSRCLAYEARRINHIYGGRYYRSEITSYHYCMHAYKYVYRNPVEAGLCQRVEDYSFSTISGLLGKTHLVIPLVEDETLFKDVEGTLDWLNQAPHSDHREVIRKALRRSRFKLPRDRSLRDQHILEVQRY